MLIPVLKGCDDDAYKTYTNWHDSTTMLVCVRPHHMGHCTL
jgi:hypothetical protein